jgi:hypothetical protein
MNKNTHGYMTVWYTKGIYVSFVNCFVVIESLSTSPGSPREILQGGTRLLLDPQRQAETSFKIEDLRFNKTTGKLS